MSQYISKYATIADYEAAVASGLDTPHTALVKENMTVYFHEYVPPVFNNIITYESEEKLTEVEEDPDGDYEGLHTDAFNTTIKSHTFEDGVGTIEFNGNVTSIGRYAFVYCRGLTSITIPNSVTSIGENAFSGCSGLTSIEIPNSVTSIGANAFISCTGLTSITIPNSVTSIGGNAFYGCSGLTSIAIPNSVTSIEGGAFNNCYGLTSIIIPNSVTSIGFVAFGECSGLTNVTIGSGVTSISGTAFYGCSSLTSIICNATTAPTIQSSTFQGVKTNGTLTVPSGSSGYDVWMGTGSFYLGYYNWTKVEQ